MSATQATQVTSSPTFWCMVGKFIDPFAPGDTCTATQSVVNQAPGIVGNALTQSVWGPIGAVLPGIMVRVGLFLLAVVFLIVGLMVLTRGQS